MKNEATQSKSIPSSVRSSTGQSGSGGTSPLARPKMKKSTMFRILERNAKTTSQDFRCVKLPRLVFGTKESQETPNPNIVPAEFDSSKFETLRWRYRSEAGDQRNGYQKVIMDVSEIPDSDPMFTDHAFSLHQPSKALCPSETLNAGFEKVIAQPLSVNHYVGTWEHHVAKYGSDASRKVSFGLVDRVL